MPDQDPNITVDITGNTASLATDFNTSGSGITNAHVQIMKVAWGDDTISNRVTANSPLPIQIQGGTGPLDVNIADAAGITYIRNRAITGGVEYLAVAGSTTGSILNVAVSGLEGATAITVTGDVRLPSDAVVQGVGITTDLYVGMQFSGVTSINDAAGATYATHWPIAITGGRYLDHTTDSVRIENSTIGISGGRVLSSSTDAIKVYGSDGGDYVKTSIFHPDGTTLGFSGDAMKVWLGGAGISATVNVSSTHGVTNAAETPLRVQGWTAGAGHDPLIIRGENSGALEVISTAGLNTTVSNEVSIDDDEILSTLRTGNIKTNLDDIKQYTSTISDIRTDLSSGKMKAQVTGTPPNRVVSGSVVATSSSQILGGNTKLSSGINIKNSPSSTEDVVIGGININQNVNNGYILEPGESIFLEIDNPNKVYVRLLNNTGRGSARVVYLGS